MHRHNSKILKIERALRTADITVAELRRRAPVDGGLWSRWKRSLVEPRPDTWQRVVETANQMIAERRGRAA